MSTCEHRGPGPCHICEHVEQASIPSSPEVEEQRRIERDLCLRIITRDPSAEHVQEGTALLIAYRESVHAASTQPLLAEIERLKGESEDLSNERDRAVEGLLRFVAHPDAEDGADGALCALVARAVAEAQKLREALTKADGVVQKYVKARDDFYYAESGEVERHYERLVEDAYGYLKGLPDDIRKALGGS